MIVVLNMPQKHENRWQCRSLRGGKWEQKPLARILPLSPLSSVMERCCSCCPTSLIRWANSRPRVCVCVCLCMITSLGLSTFLCSRHLVGVLVYSYVYTYGSNDNIIIIAFSRVYFWKTILYCRVVIVTVIDSVIWPVLLTRSLR